MTQRQISVSTAPFDGYSLDRALESMSRVGVTHIEPALVPGYVERFNEDVFSACHAAAYEATMRKHGLSCVAFSAHLDLGLSASVGSFKRRMEFAKRLGARFVNTFTTIRRKERQFFINMEKLLKHAESLDVLICLENSSDGSDALFNVAADAVTLLQRLNSGHVGINYDTGNIISHRPELDPVADALSAIPHCTYMHLKDLHRTPDGWFFTQVGSGDLDAQRVLETVSRYTLPLSIELPLRTHRQPDATPGRGRYRIPLGEIESKLSASLEMVHACLQDASPPAAV